MVVVRDLESALSLTLGCAPRPEGRGDRWAGLGVLELAGNAEGFRLKPGLLSARTGPHQIKQNHRSYRPGSVCGLKSALSLTLSLKGEGTVGQTLVFWSQPASTEIAG